MARIRAYRKVSLIGGVALALVAGGALALTQNQPAQPAPQHDHPHPPTNQPPATGNQPVPTPTPAPIPTGPAPQLVVDRTVHDFGVVMDDTSMDTEFTFTNKGDAPLSITSLTATCGCTVPQLTKRDYAPGESGRFKVTFNPQGKHGQQSQRITILSNDPRSPTVADVKALVKTSIMFDPAIITFNELRQGQPQSQVIRVLGRAENFDVTYASISKGRLFSAKVLDKKPAEHENEKVTEARVEISYNGNAPTRGLINATATLRTSDPKAPLSSIQINGEVVGELKAVPAKVNAGALAPAESFTRSFRLSTRTGKPFKISAVELKDGNMTGFRGEWKPAAPDKNNDYIVTMYGTTPSMMGAMNLSVLVKTDVPGDETLTMDVTGQVRPKMVQPQLQEDRSIQGLPIAPEGSLPNAPTNPTNQPPGTPPPATTGTPPAANPPPR